MTNALVTGAAGGLGQALGSALSQAGYRVVGTDRRPAPDWPGPFVELDLERALESPSSWSTAQHELRQALANESLGLLVNNAAVQIRGGVDEISLEDWQATLAVNVSAPLFLSQAFLPELERAGGTIVNVASVHARATKPRFVSYAASKAALVGLTRAMAIDLGSRVRVLAVNPAAIDTPMLRAGFADRQQLMDGLASSHPLGRIARAEEIAAVVLFLASPGASFMSGSTVDVDGGVLSRLHDPE